MRRHRVATGKDCGDDVLQITTTLYHAWKALEEVRSDLIDDAISALSNPHSHLVDEQSALVPSRFRSSDIVEFHLDEIQPVIPVISSTGSGMDFRCQPMGTTSSDSQMAKNEKKKQARRLKKWNQMEAKWVRDFGTVEEDSLVERFPCPLCPGLQRRYPRSTLFCHL